MLKDKADKAKILFVLHLPPPIYGATVANKYILDSNIINQEFETQYINLATNTKLVELNKPTFSKFFTFLRILYKVFTTLLTKRFDLGYVSLTASGPAFYKDAVVILLLKMFRVKIVYFFHNKGVLNASRSGFNNLLYKFVFHNTKSIILSKYLYPDIEKYVAKENVFYCPYGIPTIAAAEYQRVPRVNEEPCKLLFFGNMTVEKGILVLLEACKKLQDKNYPFRCDYVGGWHNISEEDFKSSIKQYSLQDHVIAHGPKYTDDKYDFFKGADIFVFPTYYGYETFGLVNLEAMQFGLPIISTPVGGIPDAVIDGKTGLLVSTENVDALTEKLELLINNPALRLQMGEAGKERFAHHFTLQVFENKVIDIIREITAVN